MEAARRNRRVGLLAGAVVLASSSLALLFAEPPPRFAAHSTRVSSGRREANVNGRTPSSPGDRYLNQLDSQTERRRFPYRQTPILSSMVGEDQRIARRNDDEDDLLIELPSVLPQPALRMLPGATIPQEAALSPAESVPASPSPPAVDRLPATSAGGVGADGTRGETVPSTTSSAPATPRSDPPTDAPTSVPVSDDVEDLLHGGKELLPPNFPSPRWGIPDAGKPRTVESPLSPPTPPTSPEHRPPHLPTVTPETDDANAGADDTTTNPESSPTSAEPSSPSDVVPTDDATNGQAGTAPRETGREMSQLDSTPRTRESGPEATESGDADASATEPPTKTPDKATEPAQDPHASLFESDCYPSAKTCAKCHERIYREWSVSSHAYAGLSPMFIKFEQKINDLARGTIGNFCMRCHAPVASELAIGRDQNILDVFPTAREGVTCVVCHRVTERYGRVNGERRIETGSIFAPVVGTGNGKALQEVIAKKEFYKVKPDPGQKGPGQEIHRDVVHFDQVGMSSFCVSCHQVAVYPGIKLEVVWEQYRASPACKSGIRCQDCHMGVIPGQAAGFEQAPVAVVNDKPVGANRRHSNHMFVGPGYSIAHPGIFPAHAKADRWTPQQWLEFDWRAGWGTEAFEDRLEDSREKIAFPPAWANVDDRYDAREIIDENLKLLAEKTQQRSVLMETSSKLQGPFFDHPPQIAKPLRFYYELMNLNSGHNMPSGSLGAQPQIWVNVVLNDPAGQPRWESGYVDANGDMADVHSLEVAAGRTPRDVQLVNLQTKFLITTVKGTDREMYLPINIDFDQLPFIRPNSFPVTTMNHPPFIRMEAHSIPPLGRRRARYEVPGNVVCVPGKYRLSVRMRSRAEPIYFMRFCGATAEMERSMNENILDFHQQAFEFTVK